VQPGEIKAAERECKALTPWAEAAEVLVEQLYADSQAGRWDLSKERFIQSLEGSVRHRFSGRTHAGNEIEAYLRSLRVEDLALACACADGCEAAWEHFFRTYRGCLYAAAGAITGLGADDPRARELADSLYADLYGAGSRTERRSLFSYFHGRSKLETWLRAVLAQRHVDRVRAARRLESLNDGENEDQATPLVCSHADPPADPDRQRYLTLLRKALDGALSKLDARDRARLSFYYAEGWTLAQIGWHLGEHEATASRNLERIRRELRGKVEELLRAGAGAVTGTDGQPGLSDAQIELCFEYAVEDWPFDLREALQKSQPSKANPGEQRS
jgi:RNA polymerase sigma factor (sigma-70 family)